jgi:hypothetical protein
MNINSQTSVENRLDQLLADAIDLRIKENEFIRAVRDIGVPLAWVENRLEAAHSRSNAWGICLLLDCLEQGAFPNGVETKKLASVLCSIMEDPKTDGGTIEVVTELVGYLSAQYSTLCTLANICTSPRWSGEGWPDLRNAPGSMLAIHRAGACTREELIATYSEILDSPNISSEDCGLRDAVEAFMKLAKSEA